MWEVSIVAEEFAFRINPSINNLLDTLGSPS